MARRDATSKKRTSKKPLLRRRTTDKTATVQPTAASSITTSNTVKNAALCDNDEDGPDCQCFLRRGLFLPPGMDEEMLDEGGDEQRRK
jgi:hypothetical protein